MYDDIFDMIGDDVTILIFNSQFDLCFEGEVAGYQMFNQVYSVQEFRNRLLTFT